MNQQPQHHQPRIVIPDALLHVMAFIGYAIGGLLAGQVIGILLFY